MYIKTYDKASDTKSSREAKRYMWTNFRNMYICYNVFITINALFEALYSGK